MLSENARKRRNLSIAVEDQDNTFNKDKLTRIDKFIPKRNPKLDEESVEKKHVNETVRKIIIPNLMQNSRDFERLVLETLFEISESLTENKY